MSEVLYTTRWNDLTRRPVAGHRWLTPDEARRRYDAAEGLEIVDAGSRDEDGTPRPRWVIGAYGRFRVELFTPAGAVARYVDWDLVDGRLWRWVTVTYAYPDDSTPYPESAATRRLTSSARPDGSASFSVRDESGETHTTHVADVAAHGCWLDVPAFGEWGPIIDTSLGAPSGPSAR